MLNIYKKNIDLVKFMLQPKYGFKKSKVSTETVPVLERDNEKGKESYVVKRNKEKEFHYWSTNGKDLKSQTIVDFYKKEHSAKHGNELSLKDIETELQKYVDTQHCLTEPNCPVEISSQTDFKEAFNIKGISKLEDRSYLYDKGLKDEIIDHPKFKDLIHNINEPPKEENKPLLAYSMVGDDGLVAFNVKIPPEGEKNIGSPENALVCTKLTDSYPPINTLIICESVEDAMSHYQLNYNGSHSENIRYLCTCGQPSLEQTRLIQKNIDTLKPGTLAVAMPNDKKGEYYHSIIVNNVQMPDEMKLQSNKYRGAIETSQNGDSGYLKFTLPKDHPNFKESYDKVYQCLDKNNERFKNILQEGKPFDVEINISDVRNDVIFNVKFKDTKAHWGVCCDVCNEVKFDQHPFIRRDTPDNLDFNKDVLEDLEVNNDLNKSATNKNDNDISM